MNQQLRANKQAIRAFLRTEVWTVEKLCALRAHAEDKLSMWSCCCLIGVATADHALQGKMVPAAAGCVPHYRFARRIPLASEAEYAFSSLGGNGTTYETNDGPCSDEKRRRLIRPIIRAELRRRQRIREAAERADREAAILTMAAPYMAKLTVDDVAALCALADDDNLTLAEMAMNPALWPAEGR